MAGEHLTSFNMAGEHLKTFNMTGERLTLFNELGEFRNIHKYSIEQKTPNHLQKEVYSQNQIL